MPAAPLGLSAQDPGQSPAPGAVLGMHRLSFKTIKHRSNWGGLNGGCQCISAFSVQLTADVRLQIRSGSQAPMALTVFMTSGETQ